MRSRWGVKLNPSALKSGTMAIPSLQKPEQQPKEEEKKPLPATAPSKVVSADAASHMRKEDIEANEKMNKDRQRRHSDSGSSTSSKSTSEAAASKGKAAEGEDKSGKRQYRSRKDSDDDEDDSGDDRFVHRCTHF